MPPRKGLHRFAVFGWPLQHALNPIEGSFFKAADLRLRNPDLLRHLHLRPARQKPHGKDSLFPVGQVADRLPKDNLIKPVSVVVRVADLIHNVDGVASVGEHRLAEGNGIDDAFQRQHNVLLGDLQLGGDLFDGRLALVGGGEPLLRLHDAIGGVLDRAGNAKRVAVAQVPTDLPDDHRNDSGM